MSNLSPRQQAIVDAVANFKTASRAIVYQFELVVREYWSVDRQSCDNLTFFLIATKRHPRIHQAAKKLMPMYAPVVMRGNKVANVENTSRKTKARCKGAVGRLVALNLTSLLSHPSIKVEIEFDWSKREVSFTSSLVALLDKGVSITELRASLDVAEKKYIKAHTSDELDSAAVVSLTRIAS